VLGLWFVVALVLAFLIGLVLRPGQSRVPPAVVPVLFRVFVTAVEGIDAPAVEMTASSGFLPGPPSLFLIWSGRSSRTWLDLTIPRWLHPHRAPAT
jgi:hypothetical protein